jgi:hypothetical protein
MTAHVMSSHLLLPMDQEYTEILRIQLCFNFQQLNFVTISVMTFNFSHKDPLNANKALTHPLISSKLRTLCKHLSICILHNEYLKIIINS